MADSQKKTTSLLMRINMSYFLSLQFSFRLDEALFEVDTASDPVQA